MLFNKYLNIQGKGANKLSEAKPTILKIGGSVITDKNGELAAKTEDINRIAEEIKRADAENLVVVHGGGSFGHPTAKKYGIKDKVLIEETKTGIMLKPLPSPAQDFGSLKSVFKKQSSKELLEEARKEESVKGKEYTKRA